MHQVATHISWCVGSAAGAVPDEPRESGTVRAAADSGYRVATDRETIGNVMARRDELVHAGGWIRRIGVSGLIVLSPAAGHGMPARRPSDRSSVGIRVMASSRGLPPGAPLLRRDDVGGGLFEDGQLGA